MFFFSTMYYLTFLNPAIWNVRQTYSQQCHQMRMTIGRRSLTVTFFLHILFCFCDVQENVFAMGNSDFELLPSAIQQKKMGKLPAMDVIFANRFLPLQIDDWKKRTKTDNHPQGPRVPGVKPGSTYFFFKFRQHGERFRLFGMKHFDVLFFVHPFWTQLMVWGYFSADSTKYKVQYVQVLNIRIILPNLMEIVIIRHQNPYKLISINGMSQGFWSLFNCCFFETLLFFFFRMIVTGRSPVKSGNASSKYRCLAECRSVFFFWE